MRMLALTAILIATNHSALADARVLDGTDASLDEGMITNMIIALSDEGFSDPASAQFHSLGLATNRRDVQSICGYVNMKGQNGSYVGFMPFIYPTRTGNITVVLPPEEEPIPIGEFALTASGCDDVLGLE